MLYKVHVEAMMLDAETAEYLVTDEGWLDAMQNEARTVAENANKTVLSTPDLVNYTLVTVSEEGSLYDFEFNMQVA